MQKKRAAGAINVRELARNTSAVLDRVREADAPIIITRRGIPVAAIHPLEIDPWRPLTKRAEIPEVAETPIDMEDLDLDETQMKVLSQVGERFRIEDVERITGLDPSATALICTRLELKGLSTLGMTNYGLTKTGRRVAAFLRDQDGREQNGAKEPDQRAP